MLIQLKQFEQHLKLVSQQLLMLKFIVKDILKKIVAEALSNVLPLGRVCHQSFRQLPQV